MVRKNPTNKKRPQKTKHLRKRSKTANKIKALHKKETKTSVHAVPKQPSGVNFRNPEKEISGTKPKTLPKKRKSKNFYYLNRDESVDRIPMRLKKIRVKKSRPKKSPRKRKPRRSVMSYRKGRGSQSMGRGSQSTLYQDQAEGDASDQSSDSFHSARSSLSSYKDARSSLSSAKSKGNRKHGTNQNAFVPEGVNSLKRRHRSKEIYDRNGHKDNMKVFELKGDVLDEYFANNYREMHRFKPNVLVCQKKDNPTQKVLVKFEDNTPSNVYLSSDYNIVFSKEMSALSALQGTKLASEIVEFVRDSNRSMLVTKFDDGFEELTDYLNRESSNVTYYDIDKFMHNIVMGVIKMNRLGVYHGDIKLDNILINKEHEFKFIGFDFCYFDCKTAIAYIHPLINKPVPYHDQLGDKIMSTERSGTPEYTYPEVLFNVYMQNYDVVKKQVYEIGAIYHYILASEPIYNFNRETEQITLNKSPTLSNKQSAIIDACTDSDPSKRVDLVDLAKYFLQIDEQNDAQNNAQNNAQNDAKN